MPELVESINCPKCGGPLALTTGEVIVTCPYCGTASRIRGEKPFVLRHAMLSARTDRAAAEGIIAGWMSGGVLKPEDLRRKSQILVAFGSCACEGCIPALANLSPVGEIVHTAFNTLTTDNPHEIYPRISFDVPEG